MKAGAKYDVFLSSKREDYHLASGVYDFLSSKGLNVFLACEELKKLGEGQYAEAIDEVLDNSIHMIVVASSIDHIKSRWVKYEWGLFSNDLKSGYREGNLLTILDDSIQLKDLPASLRHQQSFLFSNYKQDILDYLYVTKESEPNEGKTQPSPIPATAFLQILMNAADELRGMKIYAADSTELAFEKMATYNSRAADIFSSVKAFISKEEREKMEEQYKIAEDKMSSIQIKLIEQPSRELSKKDLEVAKEAAVMQTKLRHELSRILEKEIERLIGNS
jgi:hypothetical protein